MKKKWKRSKLKIDRKNQAKKKKRETFREKRKNLAQVIVDGLCFHSFQKLSLPVKHYSIIL